MKHLPVSLVFGLALMIVAAAACAPSAPPPAPTKAAAAPTQPPAPTKAAEPTKPAAPAAAPTVAPTPVPAKTVDYPTKGKTISLIIPWAAGGTTDVPARVFAPLLEKDLSATIQVVNKPGAGSQTGITELALSKPDGYTLGFTNLGSVISIYLDPDRKPQYSRKDLQGISVVVRDPGVMAVRGDSPYKTAKDIVDAAKANPGKIKAATSGVMTGSHLYLLMLQEVAKVEFAIVHFDGAAPGKTALLGGHIDALVAHVGASIVTPMKEGQIGILGVMDKEENQYLPGIKTFEAQGYPVYGYTSNTLFAPGGTPKEIGDILLASMLKATQNAEFKKSLENIGSTIRVISGPQLTSYWDEEENRMRPLVEMAKKQP